MKLEGALFPHYAIIPPVQDRGQITFYIPFAALLC